MSFFKPMDNINKSSGNLVSAGAAEHVKCLIIGSGPAGYTAAIYAARANLNPVVYEGLQPGGQLTTTTEIENFPGYPEGVTGQLMMDDLKKQAQRFGTDVRFGYATQADFSGKPHRIQIDGEKWIEADAVIIATGATAKYLGLPSEEKYKGFGVSACATCDGFFYRKKVVAVVGGGDTACEEASYLAGLCSKVYLIVRKDYLRASKAMQHRITNTPNLEVLFGHVTKEIVGDQGVTGVILTNKNGEDVKLDIDGFFLAIGHEPNSGIFKPYLNTDETGYILTVPGSSKTNVPGVFACGDVQDRNYRQAVTAAGSGCMAALDCERYLAEL
jgi:thioredoxin reductase (NADPH)